jgi:hypothetical protein
VWQFQQPLRVAVWQISCCGQQAGAAGAQPAVNVAYGQSIVHENAGGALGICFAKVSIMIMGAPQAGQM